MIDALYGKYAAAPLLTGLEAEHRQEVAPMGYPVYLQVKRTGCTHAHVPSLDGCNWSASFRAISSW